MTDLETKIKGFLDKRGKFISRQVHVVSVYSYKNETHEAEFIVAHVHRVQDNIHINAPHENADECYVLLIQMNDELKFLDISSKEFQLSDNIVSFHDGKVPMSFVCKHFSRIP